MPPFILYLITTLVQKFPMYLEFVSIKISQFKTFVGEPQTLLLTGKHPGLRFIRGRNEFEPSLGSNGSAKSTIFKDALFWCLYGKTIDLLRTPDITPWEEWGGGNPAVTVVINTDNRRQTITRSTHPNKLLLNGQETGQEEIERIVPPFEVTKHTILLGQGQKLFFDLTAKEKMDVFASALNLDRWETRSALASDKVKDLEDELTTLRSELATKEATLAQSEGLLKTAKVRVTEWEDEHKDQAKEIQKELTILTAKLPPLKDRQNEADLALDSAGTELKALDKNIGQLTKAKLEAQSEYNRADLILDGMQDIIDALTKKLGVKTDTCPTCGQSLKGTALAHHKAEITERRASLEGKVKAGIPSSVALALKNATSGLEKANSHAKKFKERAESAQTTLNLVVPEVIRLETQIRELQRQLTGRSDEVNPHREQVQALHRTVSQLTTDLEGVDADILSASKEQARVGFWVKGFREVRLHLLKELLQELEMATNALLPESGLRDWQVRYDIEKETKKGTFTQGLNVSILSPKNKTPVKWEVWSGGEGHRLRIVGALALSEVLLSHAGMQTNLEVLDEPTRDLSAEGIQDLCEFLANRAKQLDKDIFMIDHHAHDGVNFADVVTVVKTAQGSRIEK